MAMTHNERVNSNRLIDDYFDSLMIRYQYIDGKEADLRCEFFGTAFETPIIAGAFGRHKNIHESGVAGYVKGAESAGSFAMNGWLEDEEMDVIVQTGGKAIRGLKPFTDDDLIFRLMEEDEKRGAFAHCMNIDHAFDEHGDPSQVPFAPQSPKTAAQLKSYIDASKLPFIVKGMLSVEDAAKCAEIGADAIVVSSHNNRFPSAVPPLAVLPEIRREVGSSLTILVDGGIVSGVEAFKALALGADGVLVCRALMAEFRKGPEAVTEKIRTMSAELKGCMANTGSPSLKHISERSLYCKLW